MKPIPLPDPAWTTFPQAARLLADCAANPPAQRYATGIFGPNDGALIHDDERVKALNAIWRAERDRLFEVARKTDRYSDFMAHCRLSVDAAISNMIEDADQSVRCEMEDAA